jgi:Flp pilus assembly CpaF family ATPase|tara:strand:- start:768 stop:1010 length:243 start_codon:yes stop_codon:yes gene_type:complete
LLDDYVQSGTMAADQAALLAEVAKGPDRVVIIEDTRELQCAAPNLVAMRTKDGIATLDAPCRRAPSTYRLSFHIYLYSYE